MEDPQKRLGNFTMLPSSSGRAAPGMTAKARSAPLMTPNYNSRPPGTLDFIRDNALSGGGLPSFYVDGELLVYTAPAGYIAVVTDISWFITPQNFAIYPAQLSMRLYVDDAVIQGTDTMGIGQAGYLDNLYIPVKSGAKLSIRLGRGPGMVAYLVELLRDTGTTVAPYVNTGAKYNNAITSLTGVLYALDCSNDQTLLYRSFNGVTWEAAGASIPQANGDPRSSIIGYQNFLVFWCEDLAFSSDGMYFSVDGETFAYGGDGAPFNAENCELFEYNGLLTAWSSANGDLYQTSDFGVTWTAVGTTGLTAGVFYKFTVLDGILYALAVTNGVVQRSDLYSLSGTAWQFVVNMDSTLPQWSAGLGREGFIFQAFNGSLFAGMGRSEGGSVDEADLWQSTNGGRTWSAVTNTSSLPGGFSSACINSTLGLVVIPWASGVVPAATVNLIPAVYNPELRCYAQIKGQLLKSKGTVEETLLNPL